MSNTADLLEQANAILAQSAPPAPLPVAAAIPPMAAEAEWWSTQNAMTMCAVLLAFGLAVMALATYLMRSGQSSQAILRIFGTLVVIIMATFLVVAGYTNEQLGAPLGLLGTIAGYLLGRQSGETPNPPSRD